MSKFKLTLKELNDITSCLPLELVGSVARLFPLLEKGQGKIVHENTDIPLGIEYIAYILCVTKEQATVLLETLQKYNVLSFGNNTWFSTYIVERYNRFLTMSVSHQKVTEKNNSVILPSNFTEKNNSVILPSNFTEKNNSVILPSNFTEKNNSVILPSNSQKSDTHIIDNHNNNNNIYISNDNSKDIYINKKEDTNKNIDTYNSFLFFKEKKGYGEKKQNDGNAHVNKLPSTEQEAIEMCVGVTTAPEDFIRQAFNESLATDFINGYGQKIKNWTAHIRVYWTNKQNKQKEKEQFQQNRWNKKQTTSTVTAELDKEKADILRYMEEENGI